MILLSQHAAELIKGSGTWGRLTLRISMPDDLAAVIAVSRRDEIMWPVPLEPSTHVLYGSDPKPTGYWYRADADLHAGAMMVATRGGSLTLKGFRSRIPSGFKTPGGAAYLAVTFAPGVHEAPYDEAALPDLIGWYVSADGAQPMDLEVQPTVLGLAQLTPYWPVDDLRAATVMVVGTGSIGGPAAHALAQYGVGRLLLVDPDRLRWRNLVRHVTSARHVGRYKVDALAEELAQVRPDTQVEPLRLDVVTNADRIRPLLRRTDVIVCAADGVAPRRVVSHLARRANIDAVLACVLDDGAFGEVLRLRPWPDRGCLTCQREALAAAGGLDIEASLEAGYGTGTSHRPMTAVGGDLSLIGELAAKTAVAGVLERGGHADQRLPGEHAVVALRPHPNRPAPFNVDRAGQLRWSPAHPTRPGCPTCEAP
jgi:hypothetical protein